MNEHMHPLVVVPSLEVSSAEDTATDSSMARHFDYPTPGPGIEVDVDYFGPLPVTPRGNT